MPTIVDEQALPRGAAAVAFEARGGATFVTRARAEAPLKLLLPRHRGAAAWACLSSLGGGLVDGDALRVDVQAGRGASAALTTQASTKAFRGSSSQGLAARVEDDALLAVVPDPVVCYAGARYSQRLEFDLAPRADLLVLDWLTSGRAARGERWAFSSYESRLGVRRGGRQVLRDALRLDPEQGPLPARLGRWEALATAVVSGPRAAAGARALVAQTNGRRLERRSDVVMTASALGEDGTILRLAGASVEGCADLLRKSLRWVWDLLGDDPWSSRY